MLRRRVIYHSVAGRPTSVFSVSDLVDLTLDYSRDVIRQPASLNPHIREERGKTTSTGFPDNAQTSQDKPACQKRKLEVHF